MQQYVDKIKHILTHNSIDMILGDFNINCLNDSESKVLKTLMEDTLQYTQIVKSPTFVSSGRLIDHIYIDGNMLSVVHNSVVSVYYSDHEAIKIWLKFIRYLNSSFYFIKYVELKSLECLVDFFGFNR